MKNSPPVMTREQAQAVIERVVKMSKAEGIQVNIGGGYNANIRFADNRISTAGGVSTANVNVQSSFGAKHAVVSTNDLTDEGLERAVRQSEALAKLAPDDPEAMPLLGPQQYETVKGYFESTGNLSPEGRAETARLAIDPCKAAGDLKAAGFLVTGIGANAVGNNKGLFAYRAGTSSNYTLTVRTSDGTGSGWAGADHPDWSQLDVKGVAQHAIEKARLSRSPVAIEPGRYTVVLEPQAVFELVNAVVQALDRNAAEQGVGPFALERDPRLGIVRSRLGTKVMDERVTIGHDPSDPLLGVVPFTTGAVPQPYRPVRWIDRGILTALADPYREYALSTRTENVGVMNSGSFRMSGGNATVDDMIRTTRRGLLVTRFSDAHVLDSGTLLMTGFTRDGLWLIENGAVTKPVKNFRFTESPRFVLNSIEALGEPVPVFNPVDDPYAGSGIVPAIVPPIKARDFSFTSLVDAI